MKAKLRDKKNECVKLLSELSDILSENESLNKYKCSIDNLIYRANNEFGDFRFAVIGEWSSGKSSFINQMFFGGDEILPTGRDETTAAIIEIVKGAKCELTKITSDSEFKSIATDIQTIKKELVGASGEAKSDTIYRLFVDSPLLGEVSVIDTPGLNDIDSNRSAITEEYIKEVHGVIVLVRLSSMYSKYLHDFIKEYAHCAGKFIFVINITDDDEKEENIEDCVTDFRRKIMRELDDCGFKNVNPAIFYVNAKSGKYIDRVRNCLSDFIYYGIDKSIIESLQESANVVICRAIEFLNNISVRTESDKKEKIENIEAERKSQYEEIKLLDRFIEDKISDIKQYIHDNNEVRISAIQRAIKKWEDESFWDLLCKRSSTINKDLRTEFRNLNDVIYNSHHNMRLKVDDCVRDILTRIRRHLKYAIAIPDKINYQEITSDIAKKGPLIGGAMALMGGTAACACTATTTVTAFGSPTLGSLLANIGLGGFCTTATTFSASAIASGTLIFIIPTLMIIPALTTIQLKGHLKKVIKKLEEYLPNMRKNCLQDEENISAEIKRLYKEIKEQVVKNFDDQIEKIKNGNGSIVSYDKIICKLEDIKNKFN